MFLARRNCPAITGGRSIATGSVTMHAGLGPFITTEPAE
jgi:hypothetical protein